MLSIPPDKLPQEWRDEARLNSLFSPFRSRTSNPRDYDTKVTSWKQLIYLYCINNSVYSFSLSVLNKLFVRNGRPPSCLNVVIEELVKSGEVKKLEDFCNEGNQSWGSWATDLLVKRPLSWSYNTLKRSLFTADAVKPEQVFVHYEIIKQESEKILALVPDNSKNKLFTLEEFLLLVKKSENQADDIKLLLQHLLQTGKVDLTTLKGVLLVKVGPNKISEVDIGVYVLEQNEKLFTKLVEVLEDEVAACVKEVKGHLVKGHRQLAKTCLRKKHEIEKRLNRKINALHNVQVLLEQIRDVHTDADVWQSYKHALSTFNTTFKETGLSEDAVEDTMLKLGDMLEMHEDIQNAMARPIGDEDDAAELEELDELMKNNQDDNEENHPEGGSSDDLEEQLVKLNLDNLPQVPSHDPSVKEVSLS